MTNASRESNAAAMDPAKVRTPLQEFWKHFRRNRPAVAGGAAVIVLALFAVSGLLLTTSGIKRLDPKQTNLRSQLLPPFSKGTVRVSYEKRTGASRVQADFDKDTTSERTAVAGDDAGTKQAGRFRKCPVISGSNNSGKGTELVEVDEEWFFLLGTDSLGRDIFVQLWSGAWVSLLVGFLAVGISVTIGILVGGIAGFYGRGKAGLPFMLMVVMPPLGLLARTFEFLGTAAPVVEWSCYAIAIIAGALTVAGAMYARAWRALALSGCLVLPLAIVMGYAAIVEHRGASGDALNAYRQTIDAMQDAIRQGAAAVRATSWYEEVKAAEDAAKVESAEQAATLEPRRKAAYAEANEAQLLFQIASRKFRLRKAIANEMEALANIELAAAQLRQYQGVAYDECIDADLKEEAGLAVSRYSKQITERGGEVSLLRAEVDAASKDLDKVFDLAEVSDQEFMKVYDLRAAKNALRGDGWGFRGKLDQGYTALRDVNALYKLSQQVWVLILTGFFAVLGLLLFAKAGQNGAGDHPFLRKAFPPIMTIDNFVMRFVEIKSAIPVLFLLLTILAFYPRNVMLVMFIIGVTSWTGTARFVRAEVLSLRERDFTQAARSLGLRDAGIIVKHLIPNALSPVLVSATIGVAFAILMESTLSFLNLGAGPDEVTWGKMLSEGRRYVTSYPHLGLVPGIAILLIVLAFNLLGEGMREAMNPKLRKR